MKLTIIEKILLIMLTLLTLIGGFVTWALSSTNNIIVVLGVIVIISLPFIIMRIWSVKK